MRMRTLIFIVMVILLWNCERNKNPISPDANDLAFAIYFLKDENLKIKDVFNKNINDLELASSPWLTDQDIRFYDWSSHCIYLKKEKEHLKKYLKKVARK